MVKWTEPYQPVTAAGRRISRSGEPPSRARSAPPSNDITLPLQHGQRADLPHFVLSRVQQLRRRNAVIRDVRCRFLARPVGAAVFGHWGDRIGRKATLIVTLLVMGIASGVVGVLPGTAKLGVAAPLILVLLRVIQGIAVGGEWSGSVLLTMEWGDQRRRGLLGSFAQVGVPLGLVLGTGSLTLLSSLLTKDAFVSWGWRLPFVFSLVLVAIGLFIRFRILETPMFADVVRKDKLHIGRSVR